MSSDKITLPAPLPARAVQPRLWRNLAAGATAVSLAATPALADGSQGGLTAAKAMGATLWLAAGEGGEGGEGGESGSVASGDETVDFLAGLLQVEGHLATAFALVAAGEGENGIAHMGHPMAEVYESLEHPLQDLGQPPFEDLLERLVDEAAAGAAPVALGDIHAEILARTSAAWDAATAGEPHDAFDAIRHLVLKAGEEWGEGVVSGKVAELHEYQDAWGFVNAARMRALTLSQSPDAAVAAAATATIAALDELAPALPSVLPEAAIGGDTALFAAAAAKIELAAFKVK